MKFKLFSWRTLASTTVMLRVLGLVIMASGLGSATSIWLTQARLDRQMAARGPDVRGPLTPEDSRRYTHDLQLYYGQTGLLTEKWKRWLGELTQGKPLAGVIAVASLLIGGGLFYMPRRLPQATVPPARTPRR
jgi:hypothetical protein